MKSNLNKRIQISSPHPSNQEESRLSWPVWLSDPTAQKYPLIFPSLLFLKNFSVSVLRSLWFSLTNVDFKRTPHITITIMMAYNTHTHTQKKERTQRKKNWSAPHIQSWHTRLPTPKRRSEENEVDNEIGASWVIYIVSHAIFSSFS